MKLMDLYSAIKNPLDDPDIIEKLLNLYKDKDKYLGAFYSSLTNTTTKQYVRQYNEKDSDLFYSTLFNQWKNSIVGMQRETFIKLRDRNPNFFTNEFIKVRKYLMLVPDLQKDKDVRQVLSGKWNNNDPEIVKGLDKYNWNTLSGNEGTSWTHVNSKCIRFFQNSKRINIEHRLYLNIESVDIHKMSTILVQKFDQYGLPYYFKFDEWGDRDDTLVIYTDNQNIFNCLNILFEIKKEYPELVSRFKKPPLLTGKIDGWIGYGSEPAITPDGKRHSFNEIRTDIIGDAIDKCIKQWVMNNIKSNTTYKNKQMTFQDYIVLRATNQFVEQLEKPFNNKYKNETDIDVAKRYGYTLEDLKNEKYRQSIYNVINSRINQDLTFLCNNEKEKIKTIEFEVRDDKKIYFSRYDISKTVDSLALIILFNDKTFALKVKKEIIKNCNINGVDINKFCFDTRTLDTMRSIDALNQDLDITESISNIDQGNSR